MCNRLPPSIYGELDHKPIALIPAPRPQTKGLETRSHEDFIVDLNMDQDSLSDFITRMREQMIMSSGIPTAYFSAHQSRQSFDVYFENSPVVIMDHMNLININREY